MAWEGVNSPPQGLDWGSSRVVTRTTMGENPRTVPLWRTPDSQHGCPSLISAGLPQSPRLFTSLGHLTRCLLSACSFLCQLWHFVWQSEIAPGDAGIRRVTFMFSPHVWWPVCFSMWCWYVNRWQVCNNQKRHFFYLMVSKEFRSNNDQGFVLFGFCPWKQLFHIGCIRVIKLFTRYSFIGKYTMRNTFCHVRAVNMCPWREE